MRSLASAIDTALNRREIMARTFVTMKAKDRQTGADAFLYIWDDVGPVTISVLDGETLAPVSRTYTGSAGLVAISAIPLTNDLSVRQVTASLNVVNAEIDTALRAYDVKGAYVEIHRGMYNPITYTLEADAVPRFVGFVDSCRINTGAAGEPSSADVVMFSLADELTVGSTEKRALSSQQLRSPTDDFHKFCSTAQEIPVFWGQMKGNVPSQYVDSNGTFIGGPGQLGTFAGTASGPFGTLRGLLGRV